MALIPYRSRGSSLPALSSGFDDFDRFFDSFFNNALTIASPRGGGISDIAVRMDISETDDNYLLKADLPGVEEKDIEITYDDGVLTVSGEKSHEQEEEGKTFHRIERSYGSFKRSLALPADADEDKIDARVKNGILEIEIGKTEEPQSQARRIEVRGEASEASSKNMDQEGSKAKAKKKTRH